MNTMKLYTKMERSINTLQGLIDMLGNDEAETLEDNRKQLKTIHNNAMWLLGYANGLIESGAINREQFNHYVYRIYRELERIADVRNCEL